MSTWTSKARAFAGGLVFAGLAACGGVPLPGLGGGSEPLTRAALSGGQITLATPQGYCVDRRSLRRDFALLGRCDTLGAEGFYGAWELALVTVSLAPLPSEAGPPDASDIGAATGADEILRTLSRDGLTLTQLRSAQAEVEGTSAQYWRTGFVLNGQLISLALYAPETSRASGDEGARILQDIVGATRRATVPAGG